MYLPTSFISTLNASALINYSLHFMHFLPLTDLVDINECSIYGTCSQLCYNTRGSFTCKCVVGYEMVEHPTMGHICKSIGEG